MGSQRPAAPGRHSDGHWKTTTFVAGLRLDGIAAPMVLDGPINRDAFQAYVDQVLVPELKPGDVVVMDNLSSHKGPSSPGAPSKLPAPTCLTFHPLTPLQPHRKRLAKPKALLRKAAVRTIGALWDEIGMILNLFTPAQRANYFKAAQGNEPD